MQAFSVRGNGLTLAVVALVHLACNPLEAGIADPAELNREGAALVAQQLYDEARAKFNAALEACEPPRGGPACPELPAILSNLGSLSYSTGEYPAAETLLMRAIEMQPGCADVAHTLSACVSGADDSTLHGLAAVYWAEGRAAESVPLYEQALRLRRERRGASDISLLPLLTGLALAYRDSGDYACSRAVTETAIAIAKTNAAEQTAEAAANFVVLGSILETQGKLLPAEEWIGRGLEVREKRFGSDSIPVADTLVFQGALRRHEGRLREPADAFRRAVQIYEREKTAAKSAATLLSLGRVLADEGKTKDAERAYRSAIAKIEHRSGQQAPEIAVGLNALANLLSSRHRHVEAESLFHRALEIDRANFPADDPRIALDLSNSGALALERKRYDEAETLLLQAAALLERRLPAEHVEVGKITARLAELRRRQGRTEEAVSLYQKALRILEGAWGPDDPQLLTALEAYSLALRASQDYVGAGRVELQSMRIRVIQIVGSGPQRASTSSIKLK